MIGIGTVINGKYRLARLLGDGGMGSVYEAQHAGLGTRVAIKVLHPELARRTGLVERFLQEARVAAQIRSPHVVQVTDVDRTAEGQAYIVMELLEGEPLSSVLDRQHKLPVSTAGEYTLQILGALEAAHALGVIHRDLKPENVFVTFAGGRAVLKLIDFGIAKARRVDPQQKSLTVAGAVMGTAEYMAPEQARSADKVDARADIYAAGVMLFEMIAGSRPVLGDDARVIALKVERGEVVPLVQVAPEVPREIAGLVHRAMAARPEMRFSTATEMRLALEAAVRGKRAGTAAMPPAGSASAAAPRTAAGLANTGTRAHGGGDLAAEVSLRGAHREEEPPIHTMRAPPIVSALAPPAYGGAAVPAAPAVDGRRGRKRGGGSTLVLVALPVLVGAGVVGLLIASGTWTSSPPAPLPAPMAAVTGGDEAGSEPAMPSAANRAPVTSDVPRLLPTRPLVIAPHSAPSSRVLPAMEAGVFAAPPPFTFPSTLPTALPPFPSVLPPFPTAFPSVLPAWPPSFPPPSSSPSPTHAPTASGPGF